MASCKSPQVDFAIYNNITENEKIVIRNSFDWFNNIIGCPAVFADFKKEKIGFALNNSIKELNFTDDYSICVVSATSRPVGCAGGTEGDILIVRDPFLLNLSKTCKVIPETQGKDLMYVCDNRIPLIWHELGHTFGLTHTMNEGDIMYPLENNVVKASALMEFSELLNEKTNICREFEKRSWAYDH